MSSIKEEMNEQMDDTEPIVTKVKLKGYGKMMKQPDRLIKKAEELNETLERTDKLLKFSDGIELSIEDGLLTIRPLSTRGKGAEAQQNLGSKRDRSDPLLATHH